MSIGMAIFPTEAQKKEYKFKLDLKILKTHFGFGFIFYIGLRLTDFCLVSSLGKDFYLLY